MLKRYKNAFFEAIQAAGLDIDDFTGEEDRTTEPDIPRFVIHYKPAHLTFTAENDPENPHAFVCTYAIYAPDIDPSPEGCYPDKDFAAFKYVKEVFERWLTAQVRTAIDEELLPDLWATLAEDLTTITKSQFSPMGEFTEEERRQLKLALATFRLRVVETFSPNEEQLGVISEHIDYLVSAVDRLNKFDWKGVAISTLIGISTALSLDTERGRQLLGLFQVALSALLQLLR
jgi:hypothetical protein